MKIFVNSIGICGPGLPSWRQAREIFTDEQPYKLDATLLPVLDLLPSNERRRAPRLVKLALGALTDALSAMQPIRPFPSVFASSGGDGEAVHAILETLTGETPELSPTRFHHSVHNVAAGYWSIAAGSREATTSLCAGDGSLVAGLMEAGCQAHEKISPVALVAYDLPYPSPLHEVRPINGAFSVCLVLSATRTAESIAQMTISLSAAQPEPCKEAELEHLRQSNPAARALPLLIALARGRTCSTNIAYREGTSASITLSAPE